MYAYLLIIAPDACIHESKEYYYAPTLWGEREQAMHYSIDCYVAACLALSASLHLDKQSSFCSAVSA